MRKYHIILLLFLGLLLTPGSVMACDMENSKPTCEKEMIKNVRLPKVNEKRSNHWKPLE